MSDVPKGYKQTEVGVIPEDWEVRELRSQTALITKGTTPTSLGRDFTSSGINFIKVESVDIDGEVLKNKLAFIDERAHRLLRRSQISPSDILFSIAGALGRVTIVPNEIIPANTNQAFAIIRLRPDNLQKSKFIKFFFQSESFRKRITEISVQGAQPNLSLKDVGDFLIPLPPLPEQRAIASALADVDALLASLEELLTKKRQLKQGAMQELLTGRTRLEGFEGEWEEVRLGDVCIPSKRRVIPQNLINELPCIELEHLESGSGRLLGTTNSYEVASQKAFFETNDVLFGKLRPYLRKYWLARFNGICSTEIWALNVTTQAIPEFVFYIVQTDSVIEAANQSTGTKMPRAEWSILSNCPVSLPPLPEQQAIASLSR